MIGLPILSFSFSDDMPRANPKARLVQPSLSGSHRPSGSAFLGQEL